MGTTELALGDELSAQLHAFQGVGESFERALRGAWRRARRWVGQRPGPAR